MDRVEAHLYATEEIRNGLNPMLFEYSVNISQQHNYMYVEVPKVGCSSIKATLHKFEWLQPDYKFKYFDDVHQRSISPLMFPRQFVNFPELLNSGHWFQFCFVREPFARLLSVYLDKICSPSPQQEKLRKHLAKFGEKLEENISFEAFIYAVCAQNYSEMDNHWRPQSQLLCSNTIRYDYIGRMENFNEDFRQILSKIGADGSYMTTLIPHKTGSHSKLQDYYSSELEELVASKYAQDFETYDYPKEIS